MNENTTNVVIDGNDVKPFWNGYEIYGNPFDVIMEASIDYMRNSIFNVERYRNREVPINTSEGDYLIKRIKSQYEILDSMTDEQVEICRQNSVLAKKNTRPMDVNAYLFDLEKSFPTIYSECNPKFEGPLEELFIGSESSDYFRRIGLATTVKDYLKREHGADKINALLSGATDYLDPNVHIEDIISETKLKEYAEGSKFAKDLKLEMSDVDFMKTVLKHAVDDRRGYTQLLFQVMADYRK